MRARVAARPARSKCPRRCTLIDPKHLSLFNADRVQFEALSTHRLLVMARAMDQLTKGRQPSDAAILREFNLEQPRLEPSDVRAYRKEDLERDLRDAETAARLVRQLHVVLDDPANENAREELVRSLPSG